MIKNSLEFEHNQEFSFLMTQEHLADKENTTHNDWCQVSYGLSCSISCKLQALKINITTTSG